jgi:transmembrane sensor
MIRLSLALPPRDPDEAALWWMTKRLADPQRWNHDSRFERWHADLVNAQAWLKIDRCVGSVGAFAAMPEVRALREEALSHAGVTHRSRPKASPWLIGGLVAASFAMIALLAGPLSSANDQSQFTLAGTQRYSTGIGEHRNIRLADGSMVGLDTGSTVEVHYTQGRRDIRLISGQALFHVAHNASRPFVVGAGNRLITATGTTFDVKVRPSGQMSVLLVEGHINVDPVRLGGLAKIMPQLARSKLDPGQRLSADFSAADPVVAVADVDSAMAWSRGVMILRKDRLGDAVEEINRYSTTQLVLAGPGISDLTISGVFPTDKQADFVAALTAFYPLKAERKTPDAVVLTWRSDVPAHPRA